MSSSGRSVRETLGHEEDSGGIAVRSSPLISSAISIALRTNRTIDLICHMTWNNLHQPPSSGGSQPFTSRIGRSDQTPFVDSRVEELIVTQ
jgi:hypothetical protein